jgi:TetR/AcrR family tetracycline transcriptional repressor
MNPRSSAASRPRLQRDLVVDKAIATADREGLDAVTIRRLAQELGVTPMALYWHFADKDALLRAISERLWADVAAEIAAVPAAHDRSDDPWGEVTVMTECLLAVLRRHPACAELAPLAVLACRPGLDITERVLDLFARESVPPDRSADLARFLLSTCITLVSTQPGGHRRGPEHDREARTQKAALAGLPPDRYPRLIEAAPYFIECPDDHVYYRHGLDFLIGSLRHQAAAAGRPRPPKRPEARPRRPAPAR